jgi:hypothetical protein
MGRAGVHDALRGFHDLQRPVAGGTAGMAAYKTTLETRGIGDTLVLMWMRDGKCKPAKPVLSVIKEGCDAG